MITARPYGNRVFVGGRTTGLAILNAGGMDNANMQNGFKFKDDLVLTDGLIQSRINNRNEFAAWRKVRPDP